MPTMKRFRGILLRVLLVTIVLVSVWIAFAFLALRAPEPLATPNRDFELARVILVEPGGSRRGPVRVRVADGRIASIGPPASTGDAWSDVFVLPGLTEMHAHFPMTGFEGDEEVTSLLFLLHGVTTVRLIGGVEPSVVQSLAEAEKAGLRAVPRYFSCGPILDGPEPVLPSSRSIQSAEQARAAVAELAAAGADCIKAYDHLDLPTVTAMREAAHAQGLQIVGHTPQSVRLEDAHLDDVQHLRGVHPPFEDEPRNFPHLLRPWRRHTEQRIAEVIAISQRHEMAYTPTLVGIEGTIRSFRWAEWHRSPAMQLWLPHLRDAIWNGEVGFSPGRFSSPADLEMIEHAWAQMFRTVEALHAAQIPIHTGTDANAPNVVPGISLHRELVLLTKAGFRAEEALEASTRVSPGFLGIEGAGTLQVGAPADFVLYEEDPTQDLDALATLMAVSRDGRLYSKADLEERLSRYREHYQSFAYQRVLLPTLRTALRGTTALLRR